MPKLQLKHEKGALHLGGGRIFFPGQPLLVSEEAKNELLARFPDDLEETVEEKANKRVKKTEKSEGEDHADAGSSTKS